MYSPISSTVPAPMLPTSASHSASRSSASTTPPPQLPPVSHNIKHSNNSNQLLPLPPLILPPITNNSPRRSYPQNQPQLQLQPQFVHHHHQYNSHYQPPSLSDADFTVSSVHNIHIEENQAPLSYVDANASSSNNDNYISNNNSNNHHHHHHHHPHHQLHHSNAANTNSHKMVKLPSVNQTLSDLNYLLGPTSPPLSQPQSLSQSTSGHSQLQQQPSTASRGVGGLLKMPLLLHCASTLQHTGAAFEHPSSITTTTTTTAINHHQQYNPLHKSYSTDSVPNISSLSLRHAASSSTIAGTDNTSTATTSNSPRCSTPVSAALSNTLASTSSPKNPSPLHNRSQASSPRVTQHGHRIVSKPTISRSHSPVGGSSENISTETNTTASSSTRKRKKKECPNCHKMVSNLATHKSTHISKNVKPHVCEVCQRGFTRLNDLTRHTKRHWKDNFELSMESNQSNSPEASNNNSNDDLSCDGNNEPRQDANGNFTPASSAAISNHLFKPMIFKCPYWEANTTASASSTENSTPSSPSSTTSPHNSHHHNHHSSGKCHATGIFSRGDTFKNHLKALHFKYPEGTKKKERASVSGYCKQCGEFCENGVEQWLNEHVLNNSCSGIVNQCAFTYDKGNKSKAS